MVVSSYGHGKTSWEIQGPFVCWSQSLVFSWLRATPRRGSSSSVCVMGLTARATMLRSRRGGVAALIRSVCLASLPLVVQCDAASLASGDQAADWEDTAGTEFHTLLLQWDLCLSATLPGPHNNPARPSRTRRQRIDFVTVPRDWFAGVKRADVETAVALPVNGAFDHAMPVVEVVISPSKASHGCSRSVDASRAALRRPEVREQIELLWSQAPPIPSEPSVDEHAELLAKAARVAWRRAAPRVQGAPQADWMDEEAWQAVRAHAVARRAHQKASRFLPRAWLKTIFAQWRQALRPDSEQRRQELLWDVEGWPGSVCRLRGAGMT